MLRHQSCGQVLQRAWLPRPPSALREPQPPLLLLLLTQHQPQEEAGAPTVAPCGCLPFSAQLAHRLIRPPTGAAGEFSSARGGTERL